MKGKNVLALLLILVAFCLPLPPTAGAAPVDFFVCGESNDGNEATALADAQYKAAKKALLQVMAMDDAPNSLYQQILAEYRKYTGNMRVEQRKQDNGTIYLIGHVPVNMEAIQQRAQQKITAERKRDAGGRTVHFFVRVDGLPQQEIDAAQQMVQRRFGDTFQANGFTTADEDAVARQMNAYRGQPYDAFRQGMEGHLQSAGEVTVAVIGEIAVELSEPDETGCYGTAFARMEAFDYATGKKIATCEEIYDLRRQDATETRRMLLEKASFNISKELASQIMRYWQTR